MSKLTIDVSKLLIANSNTNVTDFDQVAAVGDRHPSRVHPRSQVAQKEESLRTDYMVLTLCSQAYRRIVCCGALD